MPATPAAVTKYFDFVNNDRFEELRDIFADDIRLEMAGAPPRRGVDDAVAYYAKALAQLPRHDDSPTAVWVDPSGTLVCVEISFVGSTRDERPVSFTAIDVFHLSNDGRIEWLRSFYDTASVARQFRPLAGPDGLQ
jgi:ketosteroid isomerase-like protein